MKPAGRLALLLSLVFAIGFTLSGVARADHTDGHTHPFCAQGANGVEAGGGGTDFGDPHFSDTREVDPNQEILVPDHLAEKFGGDPADDENGDGFVAVEAPDEVADSNGASAAQFHGGHGGGPGGGQGGSTFFGAGDGGCNPVEEVSAPVPRRFIPTRPLPRTGTSTEQFALMGGVFLILGATFVFAPQIVRGVNRFFAGAFRMPKRRAPKPVGVSETVPFLPEVAVREAPILNGTPATERSGELISRLKQEIDMAWTQAT